jgi:hypothetical protein
MKRRGKLSIPDDQYNFLWVEEFPLFSFESASPGEAKRIVTTHHPFTAPHPDDIDLLMSSDAEHDLLRVRYARVRRVCDAMRACLTNNFSPVLQRSALRLRGQWRRTGRRVDPCAQRGHATVHPPLRVPCVVSRVVSCASRVLRRCVVHVS